MSNRTMEKASPDTDAAENPAAPHPLDVWLKRELQALYGGSDREPLPPGIAELAEQLEATLRQAGSEAHSDGTRRQEKPEGDRASPHRGRKRRTPGR